MNETFSALKSNFETYKTYQERPFGLLPKFCVVHLQDSDHIFEVRSLSQKFGSFEALKSVSCHAKRSEFLTILGSSGSGKSTLLRILAGLQMPTSVEILTLEGQDVSDVPANRRNLSTVFQHYGLFPHLSVLENVEYGLRARGVPGPEREEKALQMLGRVQLGDYAQADISNLSGGQKQRVALARSLVLEPSILLLDEPLGALDEKLRHEMQRELVNLHRSLGMTFVYVTHSQEEALTMSDRIILMNEGNIVQEGTPHEIFERPVNRFAAEFMGIENVATMTILRSEGKFVTAQANGVEITGIWTGAGPAKAGQSVCCAFRSEKIHVSVSATSEQDKNAIPAQLVDKFYRGKYHDFTFETSLCDINMRLWDDVKDLGEKSYLSWSHENTVMAPET